MLSRSLIKQLVPISLLAVVLFIAYVIDFSSAPVANVQCQLKNHQCEIAISNDAELVVTFAAFPLPLEEEIEVTFDVPHPYRFKTAWIEGVNMFMGKMKVVEQKTSTSQTGHVTEAIAFLGACSEPTMRWRMIVELDLPEQDQTISNKYRYFINFSTSL